MKHIMTDRQYGQINIKMLSIMKMKKRVNIFFSNALMLFDIVNNLWNYGSQTGERDMRCVDVHKADSCLLDEQVLISNYLQKEQT